MTKGYIVYDMEDKPIKVFKTFKDADNFRASNNRPDWPIRYTYYYVPTGKKSTEKQKAAVYFCEQWLNVSFDGDINKADEVSPFLASYLEDAKEMYEEVQGEYEAYLWDKY